MTSSWPRVLCVVTVVSYDFEDLMLVKNFCFVCFLTLYSSGKQNGFSARRKWVFFLFCLVRQV